VRLWLGSLKTVPTPSPPSQPVSKHRPHDGEVRKRPERQRSPWARAGFWDQAVGSDGVEVDAYGTRKPIGQAAPPATSTRGLTAALTQLNRVPGHTTDNFFTPPFGVNYQLRRVDFPFFRLTDPDNRFRPFCLTPTTSPPRRVSSGNTSSTSFPVTRPISGDRSFRSSTAQFRRPERSNPGIHPP